MNNSTNVVVGADFQALLTPTYGGTWPVNAKVQAISGPDVSGNYTVTMTQPLPDATGYENIWSFGSGNHADVAQFNGPGYHNNHMIDGMTAVGDFQTTGLFNALAHVKNVVVRNFTFNDVPYSNFHAITLYGLTNALLMNDSWLGPNNLTTSQDVYSDMLLEDNLAFGKPVPLTARFRSRPPRARLA